MTAKQYFMFIYFVLCFLLLAQTAIAGEAKYGEIIREAALEHDIDPDLALSIAEVESKFNEEAIGDLGEIGLFQLRPEFHNVVKGNVRHNARVAMAYLNDLRTICGPKYGSSYWVCYSTGPYRKKITTPKLLPYYRKVNDALQRRKALKPYVGQ